jgi:hypothetical protein
MDGEGGEGDHDVPSHPVPGETVEIHFQKLNYVEICGLK